MCMTTLSFLFRTRKMHSSQRVLQLTPPLLPAAPTLFLPPSIHHIEFGTVISTFKVLFSEGGEDTSRAGGGET